MERLLPSPLCDEPPPETQPRFRSRAGRSTLVIIVIMLAAVMCGCRSHQLHRDQHAIRQAIVELQTEQIMDNLIRAHRGMPFVHIDYKRSTGTVTQEASASAETVQVSNTMIVNGAAAVLSETARLLGGGKNQAQLTIEAQPVYDQNSVYRAYLEFLEPDDELGERLVATCDPPPPGAAHICRFCCERYYWVPTQFQADFLKLALRTTALRGDAIEVPRAFQVTVVDVQEETSEAGFTVGGEGAAEEVPPPQPLGGGPSLPQPDEQARDSDDLTVGGENEDPGGQSEEASGGEGTPIVIRFAEEVPNDAGTLFVEVGGRGLQFDMLPVSDVDTDRTRELASVLPDRESNASMPDTVAELKTLLMGKKARLRLERYRPDPKATVDLVDDIRSGVELIRLNEIRTAE